MSNPDTELGPPQEGGRRLPDGRLQANDWGRWEFVQQLLDDPDHDSWFARLPPEKQERVAKSHRQLRHGVHVSGPLVCFGPKKCPFHDLCPLADQLDDGTVVEAPAEVYPRGNHCVLEAGYYRQLVTQYVQAFDVDHHDPVKMSLVRELALIDLQKQRATNILMVGDSTGQGRDFMKVDTQVVGMDNQGNVLESTTTQLHPLLGMIAQLEARRERWLSQLIATPKARVDAQAKLGQRDEQQTLNNTVLELREWFRSMQTPATKAGERLIPLDD